MKALRIESGQVAVRETPEPSEAPGHCGQPMAVLQVRLAGVCNTDLEIAKGYMGFEGTLGHELVGDVIAGPDEWRGERVVCEINFACGSCERCQRGAARHCDQRQVMGILNADGAFAERIAVPVANLHPVPAKLSDEEAVFCEPLAAAYEILEQLELAPGQTCTVLGDGKLGSLVAQVLDRAGANVTAVGKHESKLASLRAQGIQTAELRHWSPTPADLVVDATGTAQGLELAIAATRPQGRLVLKSTVAGKSQIDLAPIVINEIEVIGSRCGPFRPAIEALASAEIDVRSLIETRYSLARAADALAAARRRGARKILIDPGSR